MRSALVGHTGFVGGVLAAQQPFDACFNSKNIEEIVGQSFDRLVVSGMPAAMWIANRDPDADRRILERLANCLRKVRAKQVVIMSTVAVYPVPIAVDEDSEIDEPAQTPYGRHRLQLERLLADHFPRVLAVRLPGLFGPGLRKNAIFDLMNNNEVHKLNCSSVYQFYNLNRLSADIATAEAAGLRLVNLATEPVSIEELAKTVFGLDFRNDPGTSAARYDMQSRHAALFGANGGYLYTRGQTLSEMREFVNAESNPRTRHP